MRSGQYRREQRRPPPPHLTIGSLGRGFNDGSEDHNNEDDDDDADIHAELAALIGASHSPQPSSTAQPTRSQQMQPGQPNVGVVNAQLEALIDDVRLSVVDADYRDDFDDNDDDDVTDADLLQELSAMRGDPDLPTVFDDSEDNEQPRQMKASVVLADNVGIGRAVMPVESKYNVVVAPAVADVGVTTTKSPISSQVVTVDAETIEQAQKLRQAWRSRALDAARVRKDATATSDDVEAARDIARRAVAAIKVVDAIIVRLEAGEQVDSSELPKLPNPPTPQSNEVRTKNSDESEAVASAKESEGQKGFNELLLTSRDYYMARAADAEVRNEPAAKIRRLQRVCQQYHEAVKTNQKRSSQSMSEDAVRQLRTCVAALPSPPGIDLVQALDADLDAAATATAATTVGQERPVASASAPASSSLSTKTAKPTMKTTPTNTTSTSQQQQTTMTTLAERQRLFRAAALAAKRAGDLDCARSHLRAAKGIESLIASAGAGLRIDMRTLPIPPQLMAPAVDLRPTAKSSSTSPFEVIRLPESDDASSQTINDGKASSVVEAVAGTALFARLERELIEQAKRCASLIVHFRATGETANANRFTQIVDDTKRDLTTLRSQFKAAQTSAVSADHSVASIAIDYHYERLMFNQLLCCPDLSPTELEVHIVAGLHFDVRLTDGFASYVCKVQWPYPRDSPTDVKSPMIKRTDAGSAAADKKNGVVTTKNQQPINFRTRIQINRSDRSLLRVVRRQPLRIEVYGIIPRSRLLMGLRSPDEVMLGVAVVQLAQLEAKCRIGSSSSATGGNSSGHLVALMTANGRKPSTALPGALLDVRVRVRTALGAAREVARAEERILRIAPLQKQ